MAYDFTSSTNRFEDGSFKWAAMIKEGRAPSKGVLPMSTADMEFVNAPEILGAIKDALEDQRILGYSGPTEGYYQAVGQWMKDRHDWSIEDEWIVRTPGVVAAINIAILAFTDVGEGVISFQPVYGPFGLAIDHHQRKKVNIPLIETDGYYQIDFEAFEEAARESDNKLLLFCSPHNPSGRVWTREELERVGQICEENDLIIVSDEIWHDFDFSNHGHTVLANLNDQVAQRTITCTSASKSFNLATLELSNIIISNEDLRRKFQELSQSLHYGGNNLLSLIGTRAAYAEAEAWFDQAKAVIRKNQELVKNIVDQDLTGVKTTLPEGTYLMWLDCRDLGLKQVELIHALEESEVFATSGEFFGPEGNGFIRLNVALPTDALKENMERLVKALT